MFQSLKERARAILVKLQGYTGTNNIYIVRNSFWTSMPYTIGSLLSALVVVVFANAVTKETYGTYKYILSIAGSFGFLTLTGMNAAVTQMTARGIEGALAWSVRAQLKFNALYTAVAACVSVYYLYNGNTVLASGVMIIGFTYPLTAALNTFGAYLLGKKDFYRNSIYGIITSTFSIVCILLTVVLSGNIIVIILGYALGTLLPVAYFYFTAFRQTHHAILTEDQRRELKTFAGQLSVLGVLLTASSYLDKILLFHVTGAVQLATYSLAQALPGRIEGYFKSISTILLPKLSARTLQDIRPVFYRRIFQGLAIGAVVAAAYWVVAPTIFRLVLPKYLEATDYSRVAILSLMFALPANYISGVLRSQKMVRAIYISSTFGSVALIVLDFTLGLRWGIWGLVWAQVAAPTAGMLFNLALWQWASRHYQSEIV